MCKKITFLFYFLCLIQVSNAQELAPKKVRTGFTIGGNFNRMTAVNNTANTNIFNSFSNNRFINERTWRMQYQSGLFVGAFGRRRLASWLSLQSEFNVVWCRQKAQINDVLVPNPNPNANGGFFGSFGFQPDKETRGSVNFNNVYWQIPLIANFQMDKATIFEAGIFLRNTISNSSTQDLTVTTSTEVTQAGNIINLDPPKVVKNTAKPFTYAGGGWLLGIDYTLNPRFSVRLRYEGGLSGVSDFQDLRENRMTVGIAFHNR